MKQTEFVFKDVYTRKRWNVICKDMDSICKKLDFEYKTCDGANIPT